MVKHNTISLSKEVLEEIEQTAKKELQSNREILKDVNQVNGQQILMFLNRVREMVQNYLIEFNEARKALDSSERVKKMREANRTLGLSTASEDQKRDAQHTMTAMYNQIKSDDKEKTALVNYMKTLYKGQHIILLIREELLGSIIEDVFTIKSDSSGVARVNKKEVAYEVVFSLYGSSGNNLVNLAYHLQETKKNIDNIIANQNKNTNNSSKMIQTIFNALMSEKVKGYYLYSERKFNRQSYKSIFNSKDAEIMNLLLQSYKTKHTEQFYTNLLSKKQQGEFIEYHSKNGEKSFVLKNPSWYAVLRSQLGSSGHNQTWYAGGDIGNIQDKYFSSVAQSANFLRETSIQKVFEKLIQALANTSKMALKKDLLEIFVDDKVYDDLSKVAVKESTTRLNKLFNKSFSLNK